MILDHPDVFAIPKLLFLLVGEAVIPSVYFFQNYLVITSNKYMKIITENTFQF